MSPTYSNPCVRCGKIRIESKSWEEKIKTPNGITVLLHTETVCPDAECQIIVDKEIAIRMDKKEMQEREKEKRDLLLQERRKEAMASKAALKTKKK